MAKINRKLVLDVDQCQLIMDNNNLIMTELNQIMQTQTDDVSKNNIARCMAVVLSNSMYANDEQFRLSIEKDS